MVSDKTIIICAILLSVAVGFSTLDSVFDTMAYNLFPYVDPIDENSFALHSYQTDLQLNILQNIGNDDYFIEKIKDTDVYDAFIEKYPDATFTFSGIHDDTVVYTLYYTDYKKPHSIMSVYFQTSLYTGIVTSYHSCITENYFNKKIYLDDVPTLYWINADICEDQMKKAMTVYGSDTVDASSDTLSDSFTILTDLVSVGYEIYGNIILVGVEITNDGILVHVDATFATEAYVPELILDEISEMLPDDISLELLIIE